MKTPKTKQLWKGIFNYSKEMKVLYCHAFSKAQAREIFFRRLADMHEVEVCRVRQLFDGSRENFSIKVEVNYVETGEE